MGGELATRLRLEEGRYIALHVIDDGCGIPPENLQRIFEPFFTTKATKERSGLGLAMVYGTVRAHGGQVAIESQLGRGTDVCVYLPSQFQNTASAVPPSVRLAEPDARRKKILLVDDEPLLRSAGRRMLRAIDYEPLVAENGEEAISLFQSHHDEIALVVLDVAMPIMGGAECFHAIRAIDPQARVLVASGYAQSGEVEELLVAGATGYLSKPYDKLDLARAVAQAVGLRPGIDHPSLEDLAATLEKG